MPPISSEAHLCLGDTVMRAAAAKPGVCLSPLPDLKIVNWQVGMGPIELLQGPCVLIACAGRAHVTIAGSIHRLQTGEQLVLCAPLELRIEAEPCAPGPPVM